MTYEEFLAFVPAKCMYETIYDDSDGRTILVIRMLDAYKFITQWQGLTDEEILEAVGWERAEMYMKLTPNFPVKEARKETIKNARAIEAKLKEKNA